MSNNEQNKQQTDTIKLDASEYSAEKVADLNAQHNDILRWASENSYSGAVQRILEISEAHDKKMQISKTIKQKQGGFSWDLEL